MRPLVLAPVLLLSAPALAHVAPSAESNNRYLKATLLPTEVRLTFTLFFGDRPGVIERRRADADGDGKIDASESRALGARVLAEVSPGLFVTVDGQPVTGWSVADVGLGTPTVGAGALSVDLALVARYADPRVAEHTLALEDATDVPLPGESETRVEESPGVRVAESHLVDAAGGVALRFPFTGNPSGRGEREVRVKYTVDANLLPRPPERPNRFPLLWITLAAAATGVALRAVMRRRKVSGTYTGS